MAANTNDLLKKTGASTVTTLSAPGKALAATSINVGSTTNYPTDTGIVIAIRQVDTNGDLVAGTYTEWSATVASATSLSIVATPVYGSDQVYAAGSTTQVYIPLSSYAYNKLIDHVKTEHNQDGTHSTVTATSVSAATVTSTGDIQHRSISLETIRSESQYDFVASGCVISGDAYGSTLKWSMTAGVIYIGGKRIVVSALSAQDVVASKDTYIDVGNTGTVTFTGGNSVANNAASPALAGSSIRLGIIVSGANIASVASVNQGQENKVLPIASSTAYSVTDSLGNLICPRDPRKTLLGYKQILTAFAGTTNAGSGDDVTGLAVPVITDGLRKIEISVGGKAIKSTAAGGNSVILRVFEGGTELGEVVTQVTTSGYNNNPHITIQPVTPSAGLHTYKVNLIQSAAGTQTLDASSVAPAFIRVKLI